MTKLYRRLILSPRWQRAGRGERIVLELMWRVVMEGKS